jgi:hypothetical protein
MTAPKSTATNAQASRLFAAEMILAARLGDRGRQIFGGPTDTATRRERLRTAILAAPSMADAVIGRRSGADETFSKYFARIYGEPLQRQQMELV